MIGTGRWAIRSASADPCPVHSNACRIIETPVPPPANNGAVAHPCHAHATAILPPMNARSSAQRRSRQRSANRITTIGRNTTAEYFVARAVPSAAANANDRGSERRSK